MGLNIRGEESELSTGYYGCDKCCRSGEWMVKLIFPDTNATLRTVAAFHEMEDEEHHLGPSPLVDTGIRMVSQFPLDYMHLVCLVAVRRLLMLLIKGPLHCRLLTVLSIYQPYCPVVGRRPQHVVSKFAYIVLFSARWFHSNTHPNRLSIFLLVFLVISSFRMVSRWYCALSICHL